MTDIEKILYNTTSKILHHHCTKELVNEAEQGVFPEKLWQELEEIGITKVGIDEEKGGSGFSYREGLAILKTAGNFSAPIPLAETLIGNWFLNENQLQIAKGKVTVVPPKNCEQLNFSKTGDNWHINGVANFVPFGRYVDHFVVVGKEKTDQYVLAVVNKNDVAIMK